LKSPLICNDLSEKTNTGDDVTVTPSATASLVSVNPITIYSPSNVVCLQLERVNNEIVTKNTDKIFIINNI
jgi:hypothetical protein